MPNTAAPTASERPFVIVDLISQSSAVQRRLAGCTEEEILAWLGQRGNLRSFFTQHCQRGYIFCSHLGFCDFFNFYNGKFVFYVNHGTWIPE